MSQDAAARKQELFDALGRELPGAPDLWFVPGRIELLGKHTDYAGGRSLLCAVERGFCVASRPRSDAEVRLLDAMSGSRIHLRLDAPAALGGWGIYPATVARRLSRDFDITRGIELAFASDLPPAAGVSSSTALCIAVFFALAAANQLASQPAYRAVAPDPVRLADYLGAVENGRPFGPFAGDQGAGILGGSQDQTAILCAIAGELVQYSFDPVRFEARIPVPTGRCLVVGASGVLAEKSGGARDAYNAAALAVLEILRRWREATGRLDRTLSEAVRSEPDAPGRLVSLVQREPQLLARLQQFMTESEELVPAAAAALARGDLATFGDVVDRSHAGADHGLRNQIPETIHLARSARRLGADAASAFGAGFGGSVWAMVEQTGAQRFCERWSSDYHAAFPQHAGAAQFFTTPAGPRAVQLTQ